MPFVIQPNLLKVRDPNGKLFSVNVFSDDTMQDRLDKINNAIDSTLKNVIGDGLVIAPVFNGNEAYNIGEYVLRYDDQNDQNRFPNLYRFVAPHIAGNAWDPEEVKATLLTTELQTLIPPYEKNFQLYPFEINADRETIIYNEAEKTTPVYSLLPVKSGTQTIGMSIKHLHIITDRTDKFYIHGLYRNSNNFYAINIHSFDNEEYNLLLLKNSITEDDDPWTKPTVSTYQITSDDGGTKATITVDWSLVPKNAWSTGGIGNYKNDFRKLATISESCITRVPNAAILQATQLYPAIQQEVVNLKSTINDIFENDALLTEQQRILNIGWHAGYINNTTGEVVPDTISGTSCPVYSDLIDYNGDVIFNVKAGFRARRYLYKRSDNSVSGNSNQTIPYNATIDGASYKFRIQIITAEGASVADAQAAAADMSDYVDDIVVPSSKPPITSENLESIGIATQDYVDSKVTVENLDSIGMATKDYVDSKISDKIIKWTVGYIDPLTGELHPGNTNGNAYPIYSDLIDVENAFSVSVNDGYLARWFRYTKAGVYDAGVGNQTLPKDWSFDGSAYAYRIQIIPVENGTVAQAQEYINNIDDYVTIEFFKNEDYFIDFLPIEDVYIGDVQQRIYFNEIARYNEHEGYFSVSVSGATYPDVTYTDRYIQIVPIETKDITLTIRYYIHDVVVKEKTIVAHCNVSALPEGLKVMFLGDSYTANGGMVKWFADHNSNVTLYGSRTTTFDGDDAVYYHEGRGSWTATHYLDYPYKETNGTRVDNPFYDPDGTGAHKFDFKYYMNYYNGQDGRPNFRDVDIVIILLGRNSGFPISNMDKLDYMVSSIKSYNSNIKVVLMAANNLAADNSGAGAILQNVHTANRQAHIYNTAFYERYKDSTDVIMCFPGLNLDNVYDFETEEVDASITNDTPMTIYKDNVHPHKLKGLSKFGIALNGVLRNVLNSQLA